MRVEVLLLPRECHSHQKMGDSGQRCLFFNKAAATTFIKLEVATYSLGYLVCVKKGLDREENKGEGK